MTDTSDATYGVLTDESFERSRTRIGVPQVLPNMPHNLEVSKDGLRHFAYGYGDDNPLYCDDDYAKGTRWGGAIGPPTFLYTMGEDASPRPVPPENKALLKGDPFAGLGSYQAVMEFEWWRPLAIGWTLDLSGGMSPLGWGLSFAVISALMALALVAFAVQRPRDLEGDRVSL